MMSTAMQILLRIRRKWQFFKLLEISLFALCPAVLVYALFDRWSLAILFFIGPAMVLAAIYKPWTISLVDVCSFIDYKFGKAEFSTGLLLKPKTELSSLASLQQQRMAVRLKKMAGTIKRRNYLIEGLLSLGLTLIIAFLISHYLSGQTSDVTPGLEKQLLEFQPLAADTTNFKKPILKEQLLTIHYPGYTNLKPRTVNSPTISALEGSTVLWRLKFDQDIDSVFIELRGESYSMSRNNGYYSFKMKFDNSAIYNFKFLVAGRTYVSELSAVEVTKDQRPRIEIKGLRPFTAFNIEDNKTLEFETTLRDDYGLADASIIATVSKGSGEAVKFRELQLGFNTRLKKGSKVASLEKTINLDALKMGAGEELYFYIAASDEKRPTSNITKSETFFVVIKDTTTNAFAVEGSLGADLMPDYFRSQRQLIIDTEQLIADKADISVEKFNLTSNELGFDQKALRLKYAEFMGDETEITEAVDTEDELGEQAEGPADPLEAFTHDHDGDNEHNLVEEKKGKEGEKDPLSEYLHNHEDPEAATLFTESLRSKLKRAISEMWDAELHLRLFEPEKSLVYQYRALRLIQEIKNSARIYVHRIGFDPPPIKEDVRLSGDLEAITNYQQRHDLSAEEKYPDIRRAIIRLGEVREQSSINSKDREMFKNAGAELAELAIAHPSRYLHLLQQLKWLSEPNSSTKIDFGSLQHGLTEALPVSATRPQQYKKPLGAINELFLKEMMSNE